jgi:hypothetical protein
MQLGRYTIEKGQSRYVRVLMLAFLLVMSVSCASSSTRGDVIRIWENQLTIRQDNNDIVTVKVDNAKDVRVLDTVVIKDNKANVKERLLDDDFCRSTLCNF